MSAIEFSAPKAKSRSITIYSVIAFVATIVLLTNFQVPVNKPLAYLVIAGFSSISILSAAKKVRLLVEKISFNNEEVKFVFINTLKDPICVPKLDLQVEIGKDFILFKRVGTKEMIAKADKNNLLVPESWDVLIAELGNLNTNS